MAYSDNISRLSRLTSILIKLQSGPYVSVNQLAKQFEVSKRTIYRDLQALEKAGVPLISIEGRGHGIMEGYTIPPLMFTESEANAIILGEKIIAKTKDESLIDEFRKAVDKIKSVLRHSEKEKVNFLSERTIIGRNWQDERTSNYLTEIQLALTHLKVLKLVYKKGGATETSRREVEPFAIYYNSEENWILIAWCRLRNDFRNFRVDRIQHLNLLSENFAPHKITMEEFVEMERKKHFMSQ